MNLKPSKPTFKEEEHLLLHTGHIRKFPIRVGQLGGLTAHHNQGHLEMCVHRYRTGNLQGQCTNVACQF